MNDERSISELIKLNDFVLAKAITQLHFNQHPDLERKWGAAGRRKCFQDNQYHLLYLSEAIRFDVPEIFASYIEWVQSMLAFRNIHTKDLIHNLDYIRIACQQYLPLETIGTVTTYLNAGKIALQKDPPFLPTYLSQEKILGIESINYLSFLLSGNKKKAQSLIFDLIHNGIDIQTIYANIFRVTQYEVGRLWQTAKITVAHEHFCTAATQSIMSALYTYLFTNEGKKGKIMACTVSGDLHELGVRMLTDEFEFNGWDTYYLGASMPDINIISAAQEQMPDILALSVTMPYHLQKAEDLIVKIRSTETLKNLKIMVGGYPFIKAPHLSEKIGADGCAFTSADAILLAEKLITSKVEND